MEIAPAYVDVALIRFSRAYPDIPITLNNSGESYEVVAARRWAEVPDDAVME